MKVLKTLTFMVNQIVVEFISHRPMVAYRGIEALIEQMTQDVDQARAVLAVEPR